MHSLLPQNFNSAKYKALAIPPGQIGQKALAAQKKKKKRISIGVPGCKNIKCPRLNEQLGNKRVLIGSQKREWSKRLDSEDSYMTGGNVLSYFL